MEKGDKKVTKEQQGSAKETVRLRRIFDKNGTKKL
jgi:hypothetical protein